MPADPLLAQSAVGDDASAPCLSCSAGVAHCPLIPNLHPPPTPYLQRTPRPHPRKLNSTPPSLPVRMASVAPTGAPPPVTTPPPASPVEPFADFVIDVEDDDLELWDGDARAAAPGGAARQATSLGGFLVGGDTPPGDADGEVDAIDEEKAAAKAAAKREKELKKAIKDYMKTSLSRYDLRRVCGPRTKRATPFCLVEDPSVAYEHNTDWTSGGT